MNALDNLLHIINTLPEPLIYISLGVSAFVENVFPPVPGDTITAFGAFLVGTKRLSFTGVYLSTTLGSIAGFMTLFWLGRIIGRRFFIERDFWIFKARDITRVEEWFKKFGYLLILLNRFLPGIRSVISISGGFSGLNGFASLLLALLSASIWNLIWIYLGYSLGNNWDIIKEEIAGLMVRYNLSILAIAAFILFLFILIRFIKKLMGEEKSR